MTDTQSTASRYIVVNESATGHCCFNFSVMDTERKRVVRTDGGFYDPYPVCECYEEEDANLIAAALNRAAESEA